jgi:hypothetical protein
MLTNDTTKTRDDETWTPMGFPDSHIPKPDEPQESEPPIPSDPPVPIETPITPSEPVTPNA